MSLGSVRFHRKTEPEVGYVFGFLEWSVIDFRKTKISKTKKTERNCWFKPNALPINPLYLNHDLKKKGIPSAVDFPHCAESEEGPQALPTQMCRGWGSNPGPSGYRR